MSEKNVEGVYPLSPQQLGMLLDSLREPGEGIHIEQAIHVLRGELDIGAFRRAWQRVLDRHTILRTGFVWKEQDRPLQVVLRRAEVSIETQDWRALSPAEQEKTLAQYLAADRRRGFDLSAAPLTRVALFQTEDDTHRLVWTLHHILIDGWSWPIVMADVLRSYDAIREGRDIALEPARPYRDYLAWLMRQDLAAAERFWREELQGFQRPTALGHGDTEGGSPKPEDRYGVRDGRLSASATATLRATARRQRLTLNTVVQGAWALLLHRYSSDADVAFGVTVSGRPADLPGAEAMAGLFINTLPFRVTVSPETSLSTWLGRVQEGHLRLSSYEYCSSGQIHQWSDMPEALPLYESILVFENYPSASAMPRSASLAIDADESRYVGARTNYSVTVLVGTGDELALRLVYDARHIPASSAGNILKHLTFVLESFATAPQQEIAALLHRIATVEIPRVRSLQEVEQLRSAESFVAPRDATERTLANAFRKLLGVPRVGVRDNFFDLGGHSLLAARLFDEIRRVTGRTLPLATLLQAPTVEKLAERLLREEWKPTWSSLVPILPGGSKPPFFCVRAVGGNVLTYLDLAGRLGPDQPVYGLQAKGLDGKGAPHTRIEEMAAHYLREIRSLQPEGPYYFGGSSFGGIVAFEMAQQLLRDGQSVAVLALFDTWGPGYPRYAADSGSLRVRWERLRERIDLHWGNLKTGGPKEKWAYIVEKSERLKGKSRKLAKRWRTRVDEFRHPLNRVLREVEVASARAVSEYSPRPYPGRVVIFRAARQPAGVIPEATLGWGSLVADLEVHEIPGYHGAIVYRPQVQVLAEKLKAILAREHATGSSPDQPERRSIGATVQTQLSPS